MKFDVAEFKSPGARFRAAPFWAWNGKLEFDVINEQLECFSRMGMGGFHIHSRVGLQDEYLGPRFMECVKRCVAYAREKGMYVWLYDEDKWPSGFGGGRVTEKEDLRLRCLLISKNRYPDGTHLTGRKQPNRLTENGVTRLLAAYVIERDEEGYITEYRRTHAGDSEANRFAYELLTDELSWFNNHSYADLLHPDTAKEFIRVTHQKYFDAIGSEFSKTVPAIFTDEPQHSMSHTLSSGATEEDAVLPWTVGAEQAYREAYGAELLDELPLVIYSKHNIISREKHRFHSLITRLFRENYFSALNVWCKEHGILLSGHVMREESLKGQTMCVGECMSLYREFGLPGLDILADAREYNTAKQVQSVVRQMGKPGLICELYGVTNWDYGFRGYRNQADWLIALGTTIRVPHLAWMYMGGESKRDYPAPLDAHSPWYDKAQVLEDTLAREEYVCQLGSPMVRVAVLHPIESYWSIYGPDDVTAVQRDRLEKDFALLTDYLLFGGIDFDFLAESMLDNVRIKDKSLCAGFMTYDACIIPELMTIRSKTLMLLKDFAKTGGKVIVLNAFPKSVDCDMAADGTIEGAMLTAFEKHVLLDALVNEREVALSFAYGIPTDHILHQIRREGDERWLFLTTARKSIPDRRTSFAPEKQVPMLTVSVRGTFFAEQLDVETGEIHALEACTKNGFTYVNIPFYDEDSAVLHFMKVPSKGTLLKIRDCETIQEITSSTNYSLLEENTLLLDMAEWSLDGGVFHSREEILKIDNAVRAKLDMRKRSDAFPQPWLTAAEAPPKHEVMLRFHFSSEIDCTGVQLAYESGDWIEFNGQKRVLAHEGSFVDSCIHRCDIGRIVKGENELIVHIPFSTKTNIEACYLLGCFGVCVSGDSTRVTALPAQLGFTDLCTQGLPFYGGNVLYESDFSIDDDGTYCVTAPSFAGALLSIQIDAEKEKLIYREPFQAVFDFLQKGTHHLKIMLYGTRINQFGQLHCRPRDYYWGPKSWRTEGRDWTNTYQIRPQGLLASVLIEKYQ